MYQRVIMSVCVLHVIIHTWKCVSAFPVYGCVFVHVHICSHVTVFHRVCVSICGHVSLCTNIGLCPSVIPHPYSMPTWNGDGGG